MDPEDQVTGAGVAASLSAPFDARPPDAPPPTDAIRNSPEFRALQEQNRQLARQLGTTRAEVEQARAQAEADRQAAEAQRVEAMRQEMQSILGDDVSAFSEFAQLLQSDPVAAARRFRDARSAQSSLVPSQQAAAPQPQEGGMASIPPANPGIGVQANVPLGTTPQQTRDEEVARLMGSYEEIVTQNRSLRTRARVTARTRAQGIMSYVRGAYLRDHGVNPEPTLRQRG